MGIESLPINQQIIFTNHKNEHTNRVERRQRKLLGKIGFIKPFLKPNEKILLVTTGCSPISFMEHFLGGMGLFLLKRSFFIFTNTRLFHIPTTINRSYRNSIAHMVYSDCTSIKIKGRKLIVNFARGKAVSFPHIAGNEKKKIASFLEILPIALSGEVTGGKTHLCPRCTKQLKPDHFTCENCGLEFKNKEKAKLFSIIFPGGGYFYTGHPLLGIGDAFVEFILILFVIASIPGLFTESTEQGVLSVFLILLVLEKAVTVFHSNHFISEYIPVDKEIGVIRS